MSTIPGEGVPAGAGTPGSATLPGDSTSGATPPATPPPSPSARGATSTDDDLFDLPADLGDAGRAAIRREREARREAEQRATAATEELDRRKRDEMSESERLRTDNERLQGDVTRLTEEARGRAIREAVAELAPKLGISDPKLAARLLDVKAIELDGTGAPNSKKLESRLEELKKEYPSIAARVRGSADAGAGASSEPNDSDISARIRARLRGG